MAARKLTPERLREVLEYDPETGVFTWIKRTSIRIVVGKRAGCVNKDNYLTIRVDGEIEYGHRLAWLYMHGVMPASQIDHINGDRLDNRMSNLRLASQAINSQNQRRARSDNDSGLLGVSKKRGRWIAQIAADGRRVPLGTYATPDEAHAAYLDAKRRLHDGCTI
jgi:hypothetical protein